MVSKKLSASFCVLLVAIMTTTMGAKLAKSKGDYHSYDNSQNESDGASNLKKRVAPAVAAAAKEIGMEVAKEAIKESIGIAKEQGKKAEAFVDKKLDIDIEPGKGWETEDLFVPPSFHVDTEITGEGEKAKGEAGEQPFDYPMGVGGLLMNGCFGTNYQEGDPCFEATWKTTICLNQIDGANFIGVGFDGRGDISPESRKMSIIQRDCSGRATYDEFDVPDTMNVHGVYDTSATMKSFYSRQEYQTYIQKQSGMSGSFFGFRAGVNKAWGSSSLGGSQQYMAVFSIDIDRYEIFLDVVKPGDLSVNFLREFMDLPTSYLAPGAAIKFQDFILRWGTQYVKSGKFGGRLQIFKTMDGNQVSSKKEFSREMEASYSSLFSSMHKRESSKKGSSQKQQNKEMSTSVSVEGGDQKIASIITDFHSPTIKSDLDQWLESIRTFPKPFSFMVAPITDLVKFNPSSLFTDDKSDWGCEAHTTDMKEDPETKEKYYEINVNGTLTRKSCPYKDRDDLAYLIERRRNSLERAIAVYMEEGPISASDVYLQAGQPGCQTENYKFQKKAGKPTWDAITNDEAQFLVVFNLRRQLQGRNSKVKISQNTEKYVRFYNNEWFVGDSQDGIDLVTGCSHGNGKNNKICILGLVLLYNPQTGFLTLAKEDFNVSKESFPSLTKDMIGSLIARLEWPSEHIFHLQKVIGYLPCNVKWSNVLRFDPSNQEGKCLHFTASSKGTMFVIFAAVPNNKDTWYYVQISPYGVGIFKSQQLMVSTVDANAVGLGADILYQSYFVCLKETSLSTVIEYGKSQGTTEFGDVYLTMIDTDHPLFVRFYSFGNGEEPLDVVDAHIISRHLTKANCRGGTVHDNQTNMCVQHCHELCDPSQGCKATSSDSPLATNCNACRYVKNAHTGECLKECPDDMVKLDNNTCRLNQSCDGVQCLNGGTCRNLEDEKFNCNCLEGYVGQYCEIKQGCDGVQCLNNGTCRNLDDGKFKCDCLGGYVGQYCEIKQACDGVQCLNGGTCRNLDDGKFKCDCLGGYVGQYCEPGRGLNKSVILGNNASYVAKLYDWLTPVQQRGHHWELCWRASQDGWGSSMFHSLCDDEGPTVTIVKVGRYIFGGYTSLSWSSSDESLYDSKAFLFSLVNKPGWAPVKLPQTGKDTVSIRHSLFYLPTFGSGADLYMDDNGDAYTNLGNTYSAPSVYRSGITFAKTFLAGGEDNGEGHFIFTPDEEEVFYETT